MSTPNKTLIYKKHPTGLPVPGEHLAVEDRPIDITSPPSSEGELVLEILYSSLDPYLRGRMRDGSKKSYTSAFELEKAVFSDAVARVLLSGDEASFPVGALVVAELSIAEYARVDSKAVSARLINNPYGLPDLSVFVGALGMPGLTAWSGLHRVGKPKKGETLFVSSAAGAVGQIVGQIAKREGLTVIGSVGSNDKLDFITRELGFDAGFNYKEESPAEALPRLAPQGIDIYFENVGGEHLEAAIANMNLRGRIPICGMLSEYNTPIHQQRGVRGLTATLYKQIRMEGFLVDLPENGPAHFKEHQEKLGQWIAEGSIKTKQAVMGGIDDAAEGFVGMLQGKNFGKAVLKIR